MAITLNDVGKKVKVIRKNCKVTQVELAKRSGLSLKAIRNIEQGRNSANIRSLMVIAVALNKRLVIFFDEL